MRLPFRDRRPGAAHRPFASADIASMPEGEIDGVRQRPVPEHNKGPHYAIGISRGRCDRTHSDTDPRLHPALDALVGGHVHGPRGIYEFVFLLANPRASTAAAES